MEEIEIPMVLRTRLELLNITRWVHYSPDDDWVYQSLKDNYGIKTIEPVERLACCMFVRKLLHIFEAISPKKKIPRKAVQSAEAYAFGTVHFSELRKYAQSVHRVYVDFVDHGASYVAGALSRISEEKYVEIVEPTKVINEISNNVAYIIDLVSQVVGVQVNPGLVASKASVALSKDFTISNVIKPKSSTAAAERRYKYREDQARLLRLWTIPDQVKQGFQISERSAGVANAWIHQWLSKDIDDSLRRMVLADSLMEDGLDETRCQWIRYVPKWYPGMWPMIPEYFSK